MLKRVIISSNNHQDYLPYWKYVSMAWKKLFNITPVLAFVMKEGEENLVDELSSYGEVYVFNVIKDVPISSQSKLARWYLAGNFNEEIVTVNDIDLLPLQSEYFNSLIRQRENNELLCVGRDVYKDTQDEGKWPAGYMTSESNIFKEICNPNNLNFNDFIYSLRNIKVFDHKENIMIKLPPSDSNTFSDESMWRYWTSKWNGKIKHLDRGWKVYTDRAIDRSNWKINLEEVSNKLMIEAHMPHPFDFDKIEPLVKYLENNY